MTSVNRSAYLYNRSQYVNHDFLRLIMPEPVSYASHSLDLPIFDAEFDPAGRPYLLVGGGGGENKGGVPNRLICLDVSNRAKIEEAASIDLSRDEDSIQSIASLAVKDGLVTFAGINSSSASQRAGKNEHFRSFAVTYKDPRRDSTATSQTSSGNIKPIGQACLFKSSTVTSTKKKDLYQRITRLSPPRQSPTTPSKRIGAIATGLAPSQDNEIVLFDATKSSPSSSSLITSIPLEDDSEANDLDIFSTSSKEREDAQDFSLAYCTDTTLYASKFTYDLSTKIRTAGSYTPKQIYTVPSAPSPRPIIRFTRYLTSSHILLLQNTPGGKGCNLYVLHTPTNRITYKYPLPRRIKSGISLAICHLDADPVSGDRQILIAISATDSLVQILTCNHSPSSKDPTKQLSKFSDYQLLENPSCRNITKLAFSRFIPPTQAADSTSVSIAMKPQYIQLALVTIGGTVVVDTLALTSVPTSAAFSHDATPGKLKKKGSPSVRWVLSSRSTELLRTWTGLLLIGFVVLMSSIVLQSYLNAGLDGGSTPSSELGRTLSQIQQRLQPPGALRPYLHSVGERVQSALPTARLSSNAATATASEALDQARSTAEAAIDPSSPSLNLRDLLAARQPHPTDPDSDGKEPDIASATPKDQILISALPPTSSNAHDPTDPNSNTEDEIAASQDELEISLHPHLPRDPETQLDATSDVPPGAIKFEDLPHAEREAWKARLRRAGQWVESEGEAVLRGVLVREYAAVVGGAVRDGVLGH
ncbi:MAG: hypothetical protein M1828_003995 [Chrysothrix sp. TS-e1954]|nr:MAG: hypothetical protein M1828_003995 [Chrysothrix sp. TS-e1954]